MNHLLYFKNILWWIRPKYTKLVCDSFYLPMIRVCRFNGITLDAPRTKRAVHARYIPRHPFRSLDFLYYPVSLKGKIFLWEEIFANLILINLVGTDLILGFRAKISRVSQRLKFCKWRNLIQKLAYSELKWPNLGFFSNIWKKIVFRGTFSIYTKIENESKWNSTRIFP